MSELNNDEPNNQVDATSTDGETAGGLTVSELRDWLRDWVAQATGVPADQISDDRPMEEFGLSSRDAVALAADVEDKTGVILTATVAYNHPTIAMLATRIIEGDPDEGIDATTTASGSASAATPTTSPSSGSPRDSRRPVSRRSRRGRP